MGTFVRSINAPFRLPGEKTQPTALSPLRAVTPLSADIVIDRLERAGTALLALPGQGYSTKLRQTHFDILHAPLEAYGWDTTHVRCPRPTSEQITEMDEAFAWLALIPAEQYVLRRIVGARSLVHPITGRYLYPWRRLGSVLGADHKTVGRWHQQGIHLILTALEVIPFKKC